MTESGSRSRITPGIASFLLMFVGTLVMEEQLLSVSVFVAWILLSAALMFGETWSAKESGHLAMANESILVALVIAFAAVLGVLMGWVVTARVTSSSDLLFPVARTVIVAALLWVGQFICVVAVSRIRG